MESVLIVSPEQKNIAFLNEMLHAAFVGANFVYLHSGAQARLRLVEQDFDLVVINAPLCDETGEGLARHVAAAGRAQTILMVSSEIFDEVSAATENDGVLTVAKPPEKNLFWSVLKLAQSMQNKLKKVRDENDNKAKQKIVELKIINRAKLVLISNLKMSEAEAHKFIEKQAMNNRSTRREIAEDILRMY